jgi:hypothetical protein
MSVDISDYDISEYQEHRLRTIAREYGLAFGHGGMVWVPAGFPPFYLRVVAGPNRDEQVLVFGSDDLDDIYHYLSRCRKAMRAPDQRGEQE